MKVMRMAKEGEKQVLNGFSESEIMSDETILHTD